MEVPRLARDRAQAAAREAAGLLARDPRVRLVYLYGSAAATAGPAPRDVDLAVLTHPALSLDELLRLRSDLVATTGAPIDLVLLNEAPVTLAHEVAETGRCLHSGSPEAETEFITRARARYWDFRPYREAQWRLAGERLAERRHGT